VGETGPKIPKQKKPCCSDNLKGQNVSGEKKNGVACGPGSENLEGKRDEMGVWGGSKTAVAPAAKNNYSIRYCGWKPVTNRVKDRHGGR